jgi:AbrB family looped-hinge helix DNA binding protein
VSVVQLSEKGQIVIPANMRKKYNLKPKAKMEIIDVNDQIILCPIPEDPIEAAEGFLKSKKSVLEMLKEAREEEKAFESEKAKLFKKK